MATPFRPAFTLLAQYAEYHRDRRNIQTHLVGVPLIVFAIGVLLSRPVFELAGLALTPAWVMFALTAAWYLTRGELGLGIAVTAMVGLLMVLAHQLPLPGTVAWLGWGAGLFVVGWIIQFVGHYYEGRTPAFADDIVGLLVGPMFVVAELLMMFGLLAQLRRTVEAEVGPVR